jgi:hypothetical protein
MAFIESSKYDKILTVTEENALRMFKRKIICKMYGPVVENSIWRIRYNEEINTLPKGRLYSKRRNGRPRMRWLDDVESDLKKMKVKGWKEKMRNREQWRLVVEEAEAHPGL